MNKTAYGNITRRQLCRAGLLTLAGLALPTAAMAKGADLLLPDRELSFFNIHTGESLRYVDYWADGRYQSDALAEINHILRDHRTGEVARIDRQLLDILWQLNKRIDNKKPLSVISGYRSPHTNELLRQTGGGGVAKNSLHMDGRAIDIRIPGYDLRQLQRAALALGKGGVGYYPNSQFVHVDTGRVRQWIGS